MDPTTDPTSERPPVPPGAPPPPDVMAVLARLDRIEQRLDALEWNQRALIAYLPMRFRPTASNPLPREAAAPPAPMPMQVPTPVEVPALPDTPAATPTPPGPPPSPARPLPAWAAAVSPPALQATSTPGAPPAPSNALDRAVDDSDVSDDTEEDAWSAVPPTHHWGAPAPERRLPSFTLPDLATLSPGRLLAWVGGAALVLAAVFFLSLAFSRGWITEPMRVLIGLVAGAALMGASVLTFDRRGPIVAHVLAASGIAVLELSLYAARLFDLAPAELALLGAGIVAAAAMVIAIRFDSQPVAALGLLAVLAAPPIMGAPATLVTVAFLFLVLVAGAVVAVARGWRWLPWLSFAVTLPQVLRWVFGTDVAYVVAGPAILGYWAVLVGAALAETWRRPLPLRSDASALLVGMVDLAVLVLVTESAESWEGIGYAYLVLGAAHVALALPFLRLRDVEDSHGQALLGVAVPWLVLGIVIAVPDLLVPAALAGLAAAMGMVTVRWHHRLGRLEALGTAALAVAWMGFVSFPALTMVSDFPPVGSTGQDDVGSLVIVASVLAVIAAATRWSVASRLGRSSVLTSGVVLIGWVLPFTVGGLGLVMAWTALSVVVSLAAIRFVPVRLRRLSLPTDPLLLGAGVAGLAGITWGILAYAQPSGVVDIASPAVIDRILASLVPIIGLVVLLLGLRPRWWRGVSAALALLLLALGVWLVAGDATLLVSSQASVDGSLVVLVGWSALALGALVLDERPRLRLASARPLTADPVGHPLALMAVVPFVATLGWLTTRFFATGAAAGLPATPFLDETTLATGLVMAFLLAGTAVALTSLVRTVLTVTAVVVLAVLLPLELPLELAVVGWSVMAAIVFLLGRRMPGSQSTTAAVLGGGLLAVGIGATLLTIAPPDRLVLELTRVPPESGPPNAATLVTLALAGALAVAAWCRPGSARLASWTWLGAAGAIGWCVSVGIADAFAVRMPGATDPTEVARQAQVVLSIAWAAMGLGTLLYGLARDIALARQAGLVLLAVATVKVFVYDLATLDIAYRVLSLVGLGLLLLVSAWFYLHARHHGGPQAMGG